MLNPISHIKMTTGLTFLGTSFSGNAAFLWIGTDLVAQSEQVGLAEMTYKCLLSNPPSLTPGRCYPGTLTLSIPALGHPIPTLVIRR